MFGATDPYLKSSASLNRLILEWKQYGSLVVAFDFDGTVHDFHKRGDTHDQVILLLQDLKRHGCYLICFTANTDKEFLAAYMHDNSIPFDAINENPPHFKCDARKIYYNAYLDDRAGLEQVFNELTTLCIMKDAGNL